MDVTLAGTPSVAGATITVGNQSVDAALPEWLAEYGYNFGLLQSGRNELPVKVWLAVRGTNTTQGVQVQAIDTIAETTITTASGQFVSATPIEYSIPALGSQQWTARGGPVDFRQAGSSSLPPLPVGPGGRLQQPKGSLYILATLGEATFGLDCVPGSFIAQGAERVEATAQPFAGVDVAVVRVPERAAGGHQRRAGDDSTSPASAACRSPTPGSRTPIRPRSTTGCRAPTCATCSTPGAGRRQQHRRPALHGRRQRLDR